MLRVVAGTKLLQAPADRPPGQRGLRAPAAYVVAVAALFALGFSTYSEPPEWTRAPLLFAAAALIAGALLLWTARRRASVMAAAVLVAAAVMAGVVADAAQREAKREADRLGGSTFQFDEHGPAITREQAEAVPEGSTKDEVRAFLGQAAGSGIQRVNDGRDMRCLVYRDAARTGWRNLRLFAFCFSGERYAEMLIW
jgi:4-amino-4-deoxy-L-arabinose transferase-like glycosyltransferase